MCGMNQLKKKHAQKPFQVTTVKKTKTREFSAQTHVYFIRLTFLSMELAGLFPGWPAAREVLGPDPRLSWAMIALSFSVYGFGAGPQPIVFNTRRISSRSSTKGCASGKSWSTFRMKCPPA